MRPSAHVILVMLVVALDLGRAGAETAGVNRRTPLADPTAASIRSWLGTDSLWLSPSINGCPIVYVESNDKLCEVVYEPSRLFRVPASLPVVVHSVRGSAEQGFRVAVENTVFGRGTLHFRTPAPEQLSASDLETMFSAVLHHEPVNDVMGSVVGNRASKMAHVGTSNHLPAIEDRDLLPSLQEALLAGYRRCPVCFDMTLRMSGYSVEKELGREVARRVRSTYAFSPDENLQRRLERVGERVLERWMTPLKGYRYRFGVVESDDLNAIACPGGAIYVTSALMLSLESEAELEAIVAHELAHVELRHGYRQYRSAMKGKVLTLLAAVVAGAVVSGRSDSPHSGAVVAEWVMAIGNIATQIALTGYSREHEEEADDFAMAYLLRESESRSTDPLMAVLAKLRYSAAMNGEVWQSSSIFATHPNLETRLSRAGQAELVVFDSSATVWGCSPDGDVLLTVRLASQSLARYHHYGFRRGGGWGRGMKVSYRRSKPELTITPRTEYRVFTTVESSAELPDRVQLRSLIIRADSDEIALSNSEETELFPVDQVNAVFSSRLVDSLITKPIESVRLPSVPGVEHWILAGDAKALEQIRAGRQSPGDDREAQKRRRR